MMPGGCKVDVGGRGEQLLIFMRHRPEWCQTVARGTYMCRGEEGHSLIFIFKSHAPACDTACKAATICSIIYVPNIPEWF